MASNVSKKDPAHPRILLAMRKGGNRNLLKETLSDRHEIVDEIDAPMIAQEQFDVIVLDVARLRELKEPLIERKLSEQPAILPALLVGDRNANLERLVGEELGRSLEDVLRIPTTRVELNSRIDNLCRLRRLSRVQQSRQHETEEELHGANRALRTLNKCNEILVREREELSLLEGICDTLTEEGGYAVAWIGMAEETPEKSIRVRAVSGPQAEYVKGIYLTWADDELGTGPAGRAIKSQKPESTGDIATDPAFSAWRKRALEYGLASCITLPLVGEHGPADILTVYSQRSGAFAKDERLFLERLAANVSLGLDAIRNREQREQREREIRELAYSDTVTGLPNRQALVKLVRERHESGQTAHGQFVVLFIDLDDFKIINDALGHQEGDRVLMQVGERLQRVVRGEDIVARQGGDEFVVVMQVQPHETEPLSSTDQDALHPAVKGMAERIIEEIRKPFEVGGYSHHIGASIGIAVSGEHGETDLDKTEELIEQADLAMYQAKSGDSGWHVYSSALSHERQKRMSMESRLHQALEREEFALHYQPLKDVAGNSVIGVEALIRWPQDDGSFVSPGEFIPVAEQNGLIRPIGDWVLRETAQQLHRWRREGLELYAAVNLSLQQLRGPAASTHIVELLEEWVPPELIQLEVTESMLMLEPSIVEHCLTHLQRTGFGLSIDDFGTGYSSLSRLQHMPMHTLKIDKRFLDGLPHENSSVAVVNTILHLGHWTAPFCQHNSSGNLG